MIVEEAHRQEHTRYSFGHFLPKVVRRAPRSHHSDPLSSHLPLSKQTAVTLPEIEVQKLGREKHEKKTSIVNLPQNPQKERLRRCQVENQVKKSQDRWWEWPERKRRTEMYIHSSVVKLDAEAVVSSHDRGHHHRHNLPPLARGGKTVPTHTHPPAQRKLSKQGTNIPNQHVPSTHTSRLEQYLPPLPFSSHFVDHSNHLSPSLHPIHKSLPSNNLPPLPHQAQHSTLHHITPLVHSTFNSKMPSLPSLQPTTLSPGDTILYYNPLLHKFAYRIHKPYYYHSTGIKHSLYTPPSLNRISLLDFKQLRRVRKRRSRMLFSYNPRNAAYFVQQLPFQGQGDSQMMAHNHAKRVSIPRIIFDGTVFDRESYRLDTRGVDPNLTTVTFSDSLYTTQSEINLPSSSSPSSSPTHLSLPKGRRKVPALSCIDLGAFLNVPESVIKKFDQARRFSMGTNHYPTMKESSEEDLMKETFFSIASSQVESGHLQDEDSTAETSYWTGLSHNLQSMRGDDTGALPATAGNFNLGLVDLNLQYMLSLLGQLGPPRGRGVVQGDRKRGTVGVREDDGGSDDKEPVIDMFPSSRSLGTKVGRTGGGTKMKGVTNTPSEDHSDNSTLTAGGKRVLQLTLTGEQATQEAGGKRVARVMEQDTDIPEMGNYLLEKEGELVGELEGEVELPPPPEVVVEYIGTPETVESQTGTTTIDSRTSPTFPPPQTPPPTLQPPPPKPSQKTTLNIHKRLKMKDLAKEQRILDSVRKDLANLNDSMNSKSEGKPQKSPVSSPHVTPKRSKKSKMVSQEKTGESPRSSPSHMTMVEESCENEARSHDKIGESPRSSPSHITMVEESCDNGARSHDHLEVDGDSAIALEAGLETDGLEDDDAFLPENVPNEHPTSSTSLHVPSSQNTSGIRRRTVGHRLMTLQAPSQEHLPKHKFLRRASVDPKLQNSTYQRNHLNSRQERKHSSVSWRDTKSPINSAQNRFQLPGTPEFQNAMEKDISEIMSRVREIKETVTVPLEVSRPDTVQGLRGKDHQQQQQQRKNSGKKSEEATVVTETTTVDSSTTTGLNEEKKKKERQKAIEQDLIADLQRKKSEMRRRRKQEAEARRRAEELEQLRQHQLDLEEQKLTEEREKHATKLDRLRHETEMRQYWQLYEQAISELYTHETTVWDDIDYAYIEYYTSEHYSRTVRDAWEQRKMEEKQALQQRFLEALEHKRKGLLQKLRAAQEKFMEGITMDMEELDHLLCISNAFVYSYFNPVPDQVYMCPEELV